MVSHAPASTRPTAVVDPEPPEPSRPSRSLAVVRIALGWLFGWAFIDKALGLGYPTASGQGWIDGNSPTGGFLTSREGTFGELFQGMSGQVWSDWMFMGGMAGLGIALTLGIGLRLAAVGGTILMGTMWMSMLPIESNPFMDPHLVYALAIIALAFANAGDRWGLGRVWAQLPPVKRFPILK